MIHIIKIIGSILKLIVWQGFLYVLYYTREYSLRRKVDILCKIKGKIINVEVNNNTSKSLLERNLAYMFSLYHGDMKEGSKYRFNSIIQININNFRFSGKKDVLEEYYITNIRKLPKNINDFDIYSNKIRIISEGDEIMEKYVKKSYEASEKEKLHLAEIDGFRELGHEVGLREKSLETAKKML